MTPTLSYKNWSPNTEVVEECLSPLPVQRLLDLLNDTTTQLMEGDELPPLWHWIYFISSVPQKNLAVDGHPAKGDFLPPVELPRRMFAEVELQVHETLIIGDTYQRKSIVTNVDEKQGQSGRLVFVSVQNKICQGDKVYVDELQRIVYGDMAKPVVRHRTAKRASPREDSVTEIISLDPTMLFRFSALTFNAHRIHYDRDYALNQEGYPGLLVHAPLTAIILMELVRRHLPGRIIKAEFEARAPMFDGQPLHLQASVSDQSNIDLSVFDRDGQLTFAGKAQKANDNR